MFYVIADHPQAGTAIIPETSVHLHELLGWKRREAFSDDPGELRRIVEQEIKDKANEPEEMGSVRVALIPQLPEPEEKGKRK